MKCTMYNCILGRMLYGYDSYIGVLIFLIWNSVD